MPTDNFLISSVGLYYHKQSTHVNPIANKNNSCSKHDTWFQSWFGVWSTIYGNAMFVTSRRRKCERKQREGGDNNNQLLGLCPIYTLYDWLSGDMLIYTALISG